MRFVALAFVLTLNAGAFGIMRRHDLTDTDYRNAANAFPAVGRLNLRNGTSNDYRTATLIGDKFILTAAHNTPGTGITPEFEIAGQTYSIVAWVKHPSFSFSNLEAGYDVAVGRLSQRVLGAEPLSVYPLSDEAGQVGEIVGFGATGTGTTGINLYDWNKRAGTNTIDVDPNFPNIFLEDFDRPSGSDNTLGFLGSLAGATAREGIVSYGDSGGPFLLQRNGKWEVAGIASGFGYFDAAADGDYGDYSLHSKVAFLYGWIMDKRWESGRLEGVCTLQNYAASATTKTLQIEVRNPGTTAVVSTVTVPLAEGGGWSFVTALRGVYDLSITLPNYLRRTLTNVNITNNGPAGLNFTLIPGDIDGDNEVGPNDYSLFAGAFGSSEGDASYLAAADLTGDGEVGPADFSAISAAFGNVGDD